MVNAVHYSVKFIVLQIVSALRNNFRFHLLLSEFYQTYNNLRTCVKSLNCESVIKKSNICVQKTQLVRIHYFLYIPTPLFLLYDWPSSGSFIAYIK